MNYRTLIPIAVSIFITTGIGTVLSEEYTSHNTAFIDVHLHLLGLSHSRGSGSSGGSQQKDHEIAAQNLIEHMDRYGVAKGLIMPPPMTRDVASRASEDYSALLQMSQRYPGRLFVAGGGHNLQPMIHGIAPDEVTKADRAKFEAEAEKLVRDGVKAFGEMTALHLSFSKKHSFHQCAPDHPLYLLLADIAARADIPIDLHMEAVPRDMPLPKGFGERNARTLTANIAGLERLLKHNRKARIVWQHIGWDNTGYMTVDLLRRLLGAHANLYLALRVEERPFTMGGTPMPNRVVDRDGSVRLEWQKLLEDFPDRCVIGTDEFFGVPGVSSRAPQSFEETWRMLDEMPDELADKIGRKNAARIYRF